MKIIKKLAIGIQLIPILSLYSIPKVLKQFLFWKKFKFEIIPEMFSQFLLVWSIEKEIITIRKKIFVYIIRHSKFEIGKTMS